jgi:archaellum component FlaC
LILFTFSFFFLALIIHYHIFILCLDLISLKFKHLIKSFLNLLYFQENHELKKRIDDVQNIVKRIINVDLLFQQLTQKENELASLKLTLDNQKKYILVFYQTALFFERLFLLLIISEFTILEIKFNNQTKELNSLKNTNNELTKENRVFKKKYDDLSKELNSLQEINRLKNEEINKLNENFKKVNEL